MHLEKLRIFSKLTNVKNFLLACLLIITYETQSQSFRHPGLLHSSEDLGRMKKAVAAKEEPIFSGYQVFIQNPASQYTYKMQGPMAMVGRNPTVGQSVYDNDANAAHQNALMWAITGDAAYASKAKEIINAWSSTLKSITGRDAVLMAGLGPFKMVNAAEILRYTNAGWSDEDIRQTEKHFREVIYPVIKDFSPFANGNWDAAAIKTVLAIGVFCNDRNIFERALDYYVNGHGNGRLTHYIINEEGQIQESGRDQAHTQLGIGLLAEACEIAWHQGLNLYGYANNRLLKGFEYVAKFNLGNEVPFTETLDRTGKYHHKTIARHDQGRLRAVYEQIYYHYAHRMGLQAPFVKQAAEKVRPEGPGRPGADHPGYGTLFYTKPMQSTEALFSTLPAPPAALQANSISGTIRLTWLEPYGALTYSVKRATRAGGPYTSIARNLKTAAYTDNRVKPGTICYYTVTASNLNGESKRSAEKVITAGLPYGWKSHGIGLYNSHGQTEFDGSVFTIQADGMGTDSDSDQLQFTYRALSGDGEIVARFIPQPSSQFSRMGFTIREGLETNAPQVSFLIYPGRTGQPEAPNWHARLLSREVAGQTTRVNEIGPSLKEPAVTWGRLTGFVWLRLVREGNKFTGYTSYDGQNWTSVGTVSVPLRKNLLTGLAVASGMPNSTVIRFDHVSVLRSSTK